MEDTVESMEELRGITVCWLEALREGRGAMGEAGGEIAVADRTGAEAFRS
jgi:hypothetical protein